MSTEEKSILDEVVALKGNESFRDPEVLAKSVLSGDDHIKNLERQLKELREDLDNRLKAEEVLKAIEAKAEEFKNMSFRESSTPAEQPTPGLDAEKVEALVSETIQKRTMEETRAKNAQMVNAKLRELYGDEASNEVVKRANALGMTPDSLVGMAKESPNAFLALMGTPQPKSTNATPSSQVNTSTESFNKAQNRDYTFYENLRKEDPKTYFSPKIQRQLTADAVALGERFFQRS